MVRSWENERIWCGMRWPFDGRRASVSGPHGEVNSLHGRRIPGPPPGIVVNRVETSAEVADLVAALSRRIRIDASRDLGPLGVTWGQVRALRTLARAGGPLRMSDLADRLDIAR